MEYTRSNEKGSVKLERDVYRHQDRSNQLGKRKERDETNGDEDSGGNIDQDIIVLDSEVDEDQYLNNNTGKYIKDHENSRNNRGNNQDRQRKADSSYPYPSPSPPPQPPTPPLRFSLSSSSASTSPSITTSSTIQLLEPIDTDIVVIRLYGSMSLASQYRSLDTSIRYKPDGTRKRRVILATNVAEARYVK